MGLFQWLADRRRLKREQQDQDRYQRQFTEWQQEETELQQEIQLATKPSGFTDTTDEGIVLHKGESPFLIATGTVLVEPTRLPGTWVGGYSGVSFRIMKGVRYHVGGSRGQYTPGPEAPAAIASGTVTITDQRVVFQSDKEAREWAFSKLLGYQHDPGKPLTYFQVSNRQKVSGIGYSLVNLRTIRFRLSLALAHFRDEMPALLAHIRQEARDHEAARPKAPPPRQDS